MTMIFNSTAFYNKKSRTATQQYSFYMYVKTYNG